MTHPEISELIGAPARPAHRVEILRDGAAAFPAMLELIGSARTRVRFENFIFAGDETGRRFAEALGAAARRGVDVRILYDPVGTLLVRGGSIARLLRQLGAGARPFRPLSPYSPRSWAGIRHRDHRKALAVDGRSAVVGGLCISNPWAAPAEGGEGWRDTALCVEGPVATDVEHAFDAMWHRANREETPEVPGKNGQATAPAVWVVADRPGTRRVARLYEWLAEQARARFDVTDAYMVLPGRVLDAFERAARRGVAVRLLLPGRNNHPVAGAAARHRYESLLRAGAEIWEWNGRMLHAKTAVLDDELTLVGSSNLDPLSLRRNYELNLVVWDGRTGSGMREVFEQDLTQATRIELEPWLRRSRWQRLAESAGSLLGADL